MTRFIDVELVIRLAREGWSNRQVAQAAGCTIRSVTRIRMREGIGKRNPAAAKRMTPELAQAIEERLNDGWAYAEIARTLGCCEETIRHHFPGRGWTPTEAGIYAATIRHSPYPGDLSTNRHKVKHQPVLAEAVSGPESTQKRPKVQTPREGVKTARRAA